MNHLVSPSQSRMSLVRLALFVIPTIMFLGFLSGTMSGSTADNIWYQTLLKPDIQPPGWVFGVVWPSLYLMLGLALAMVLDARGGRDRNVAIILFLSQFVINLTWSPIFFGAHQVRPHFSLSSSCLLLRSLRPSHLRGCARLRRG